MNEGLIFLLAVALIGGIKIKVYIDKYNKKENNLWKN